LKGEGKMNILSERPLVSGLVIGLVVGILIGWLGIGWGIWPVEYTDASPALLKESARAEYVKMVASSYGQTLNQEQAKSRMQGWPGSANYACQLANEATNPVEAAQLQQLAQVLSPDVDCAAVEAAPAEVAEEGGRSLGSMLLMLCGFSLLAGLLVGGGYFLIRRRSARTAEIPDTVSAADAATLVGADGGQAIPLAQFPTEFNIGHDTYDDSFSIETATGDFLGECGMGISETIGVGDPKKVTAFEVWLFDKNDIRTITKVIMSEHAYYDDALRAKLAPKGEAALAKPGETIVLETASLIINAQIVEMEYGAGALPPQSFFNRLVVELAAWAKDTEEAHTDDFAL
jgi:hypothetical protein